LFSSQRTSTIFHFGFFLFSQEIICTQTKSQDFAYHKYFPGIKISVLKFSSLITTNQKLNHFQEAFFFHGSKFQINILSLLSKTFLITASSFHLKVFNSANTLSPGSASFLLNQCT
jgi:hypothetical protein